MNDESYERAKKRVKKIKGFYSNLITYLVVNLILLIINLVTSPDKLWFYWVAIFWGDRYSLQRGQYLPPERQIPGDRMGR